MTEQLNAQNTLKSYAEEYYQKKLQKKAIQLVTIVFSGLGLLLVVSMFVGLLNIWTLTAGIIAASALTFGAILYLFPTKKVHQDRFELMLKAAKDPNLILHASTDTVTLQGDEEEQVTLEPIFRDVWTTVISPYLFRSHKETLSAIKREANRAQRHKQASQAQVEKQIKDLKMEQQKIEQEKLGLDQRAKQLQEAEGHVINRLGVINKTQEELTELRNAATAASASGGGSQAALKARAAEIQRKEEEMEALQAQLLEDRRIVESQKTELNQLKGEILASSESEADSEAIRAKEAELEEIRADLEARSAYVQDVENQLIDQLQSITEREARLEQKEINAGIRKE